MAFKGGNEQEQVANAKKVLFDAEVKVKELGELSAKSETTLAFLDSEIQSREVLVKELRETLPRLLSEVEDARKEKEKAEKDGELSIVRIREQINESIKLSEQERASFEELRKKHDVEISSALKKLSELDAGAKEQAEKHTLLSDEVKKLASEALALEDRKNCLVSDVSDLADKRSAALMEKEVAEGALSDLKKQMAELSVAVSNAAVRLDQVKALADDIDKKAEEKNDALRVKLEEEFSMREKELAMRESSVAKRAAWNEDVRLKLISYKEGLEKHFKKEFPNLVI